MKRILLIILVAFISSAIFAAGFFMGNKNNFLRAILNTDMLEQEAIDMSESLMILKKISDGEVEWAMSFMNLRLDGQILLVDNLLPDVPNEENKEIVKSIIGRIAIYREKHGYQSDDSEVQERIDEILRSSTDLEKG